MKGWSIRWPRAREILFRIFYSTSFTIVFLVLVTFCAVTPADKIYQSYKRNRLVDIFIITGAYVLTALIAIFLYASRLYTNRSILRDIPKTYLPIEKEDLPGKRVYRLIEECLARSAVVAYHAKPRSRRIEVEVPRAGERILAITRQTKQHHHEHHLTEHEQQLLAPKWGKVAHPGWQSPAADEMPNLEFASVVEELIDLIEAKAVSLAPVDRLATPNEDGAAPPDRRVIELLTRPDTNGMRTYLSHLVELGVVPEDDLSEQFLVNYERARFRATPVTAPEFKQLMRMFAELLRTMQPIHVDLLGVDFDESYPPPPPQPDLDPDLDHESTASSSDKSSISASSVRHNRQPSTSHHPPRRISESSAPSMSSDDLFSEVQSLHTAPSQAPPQHTSIISQAPSTSNSRSRSRPGAGTRFFSANSTTSIQRPSLRRGRSDMSVQSNRSRRSRRSQRSERSEGAGSVIRLSENAENPLPYTIEVPGRGSR